jgi:hypothetical protein
LPVTIYTQPAGTPLVAGPLFFGLPGDSNDASRVPQATINPFEPMAEKNPARPDYKSRYYEPAYQIQVGENYGKNPPPNVNSLKFFGPYQSMHTTALGNGPLTTPQFNLLQPLPYWNVFVVSPQVLASYESLSGELVTQVPAQYIPSGTPNLYLGR